MKGTRKPLAWLGTEDPDVNWRIICRADPDVVIVANVFPKKTERTPKSEIETCRRRLARWDALS